MYSIVLMMALTNNSASPEAFTDEKPVNQTRYGNHLRTEAERGRRGGGCCGGGGGCSGYGGGCSGGGYYGGGRGGRRAYYGYGGNYNNGGYYGAPAYAQSFYGTPAYAQSFDQGFQQPIRGDYQSFYAGPADRQQSMPARLMVFIQPDAQLTIDDTTTSAMGPIREFQSPPLQPGKEYSYTLKAQVRGADGQPRTVTKQVNVGAGMVTQATLDGRNVGADQDRRDNNRRDENRRDDNRQNDNRRQENRPEKINRIPQQ
jgi:uncharacterized protein (TIGR03000 family)